MFHPFLFGQSYKSKVRKLTQDHSIGTKFKLDRSLITIHSHTKNQVNISNHSVKKSGDN